MKLAKVFCFFILAAVISFGAAAQPYQKGIGLRLSSSYYDFFTASYKFFISDAGALELNGGFGLKRYGGYYSGAVYYGDARPFTLSVSAAYQHHFEIPVRGGGLYWFVGGGMVGYRTFSSNGSLDGFAFGLFPTGGVDFKIPRIPLAVSADYRPTFFVALPDYYDKFYGTNFGIAARYTFGD